MLCTHIVISWANFAMRCAFIIILDAADIMWYTHIVILRAKCCFVLCFHHYIGCSSCYVMYTYRCIMGKFRYALCFHHYIGCSWYYVLYTFRYIMDIRRYTLCFHHYIGCSLYNVVYTYRYIMGKMSLCSVLSSLYWLQFILCDVHISLYHGQTSLYPGLSSLYWMQLILCHVVIVFWHGQTSLHPLMSLCLLCFVHVCLYVLCGHLLGKG